MANAWLRSLRKAELIDLAEYIGLKNYDGLRKDLEATLDEYLADNSDRFATDPRLSPFYTQPTRTRGLGSPVKKEAPELKITKRRQTKVPEEVVAATDEESQPSPIGAATTTALVRTPARALSLAQRIPLPATPADVANAVDRSTLVVRKRVASLYAESGVTEATRAARASLSTVTSVLLLVSAFELFHLRRELLADRYAFTVPAIQRLGTRDYPVQVPDMFLLLTASFWSPALLWAATSALLPAVAGYFVNLGAAHNGSRSSGGHVPGVATRGRPRGIAGPAAESAVDPLTYSVVKALLTYVVYAQGVSFWGFADQLSVARINSALYGGWKGALVGCGVTGLMAMYDAVLRK
ncbi:hypothetical protein RB595_007501 [Gaeumannomyces hyphopodioides]